MDLLKYPSLDLAYRYAAANRIGYNDLKNIMYKKHGESKYLSRNHKPEYC